MPNGRSGIGGDTGGVTSDVLAGEDAEHGIAHRETAAPMLEPPLSTRDRMRSFRPSTIVAEPPRPPSQNREGAARMVQGRCRYPRLEWSRLSLCRHGGSK